MKFHNWEGYFKKIRTLGVLSLGVFSVLQVGVVAFISACGSNPTSPAATPTPVPAATSTFTSAITNTPTNSPTVTPTSTPTSTATNSPTATPTNTPTPLPNPFVLYSNGGFQPIGGIFVFSGGGDTNPALLATDTAGGSACCSHTQSFQAIYTTLAGGGYSGLVITPTSTVNMSAFTTCTFYAKANLSASVGFNAAEPTGDTNNVPKSLTTAWAPQTITITDGARSDGFANSSPPGTSISRTVNYFVEVITTTPATPVTVNFDQVSFQ